MFPFEVIEFGKKNSCSKPKKQQQRICFNLNKPNKREETVSAAIIVIIVKDQNDATIFVLAASKDLHVNRIKIYFHFR